MQKVNIFWFRRDLRLHDNAGLYHALREKYPTIPVFIFDKIILDQLEEKEDKRVEFIRDALIELQEKLEKKESSLEVYYGTPEEVFKKLIKEYDIQTVFTNHDYEPYAIERDELIKDLLVKNNIGFKTYKDQVIFEKDEVLKDDGNPYTIYTPYSRKWKATLTDFYIKSYPLEKYDKNFFKQHPRRIPSLASVGFKQTEKKFPSKNPGEQLIKQYDKTRNFPATEGTSRLGIHLRFGTISIRKLVAKAEELNATFLNELIWREFYMSILWHFPRVGRHKAFKPEYDSIKWRNNEDEFTKWCNGQTGYPIVDAGMRQLNKTGYMHNRVRMIVGSFLCKDLLIDWRWGEAYFAEKLLDFDLAANNGGWQWVAGSGCDAAPYFRIFNPELQTKKFDKDLKYIKQWVPEFQEFNYPIPIVEHSSARERCLQVYKEAVSKK
ncbi:MAG TPA: deoxyribodipyrimidine photo-lyase [Ginsengibacter sp.]|nr:deoxyribodipyrimidine photo-lyase [Ginsengibacter sp.]